MNRGGTESCCRMLPLGKMSLRRGSRSEVRRAQMGQSWGKLGKEHPRQKEYQVQKPRDREVSNTWEKRKGCQRAGV